MNFERHVFLAKVAEQSERWDDMVLHVKEMANAATKSLDVEQRNLLSVAFKNVVGACRASWRALNAYEASPEIQTDKEMTSMLDEYRRSHVEAELRAVSKELLGTVDALLAKEPESEDTAPSRVFYLKMKGDYNR